MMLQIRSNIREEQLIFIYKSVMMMICVIIMNVYMP